MEVIQHIEIRDGRGYINRRNLKAEMVARMYIGTDYSIEDVMGHYNLSAAEVHAALAYYYDNRAALDAQHNAAVAWAKANATTLEKTILVIALSSAQSWRASGGAVGSSEILGQYDSNIW